MFYKRKHKNILKKLSLKKLRLIVIKLFSILIQINKRGKKEENHTDLKPTDRQNQWYRVDSLAKNIQRLNNR